MHEDKKLTNVASLAMILATLALGWFKFGDVVLPAMSFDRPQTAVISSEEDITARLWEDPLNAVLAGKEGTNDKKHLTENLRAAISDNKSNTCLMVVPVPGTPFPDDVETRLRIRYSVQMAMADKSFAPDNHDHLGYVKLPSFDRTGVHSNHKSSADSAPKDETDDAVDVPYEWFSTTQKQSSTTTATKILVLWLPEEWLGKEPLCRLAALRYLLTPELCETRITGPFVIGPRSSDTLKAIARSIMKGHKCQELLQNNLCFFSCQATAPDMLVFGNERLEQYWADARKGIKERLQKTFRGTPGWSYFENFIPPDDQLTDLLVQELHLRRVIPAPEASKQGSHYPYPAKPPLALQQTANNKQPPPENDTVLILSEADTSYGRSLHLAFQASVNSFTSGQVLFADDCSYSKTPEFIQTLLMNPDDYKEPDSKGPDIRIARYLRGLDTQKGSQKKDTSDEKGAENSPGKLLADTMQKKSAPAFGESQLDYAERLAVQLAADLESGAGLKKVKAVGILGGDIYDKLILLKTLRPKFKEALFFTTDLDARLWQPEHLKFTHNLVVASACNLNDVNLRQSDSDRPPPFRDVYQVTIFDACQAAIERATGGDDQPPQEGSCPIPHIYEIGKQGPVELKLLGLQEAHATKEAESWQYCLAGICVSFCIAMLVAFLLMNWDPWNKWVGTQLAKFTYSPMWLNQRKYKRLQGFLSWLKAKVAHLILSALLIGLCDIMIWLWVSLLPLFFHVEAMTARGGALISSAVLFCLIVLSIKNARRDDEGLKFKDLFNKQTGWAGWFLCGTLLIEVWLVWVFFDHAALPDNEPWSWTAGVSIWPTELVRVLAITSILWMLTWAWHRFNRRLRALIANYRLFKTRAISGSFLARILTSWPEKPKVRHSKLKAREVFQCYRLKAGFAPRCCRVIGGMLIYFMFLRGISLLAGMPINTNIRGDWAQKIDFKVLSFAVFCWLILVFYVLDSVYLAAQLLKGLGGGDTEWPKGLLKKHQRKFGVNRTDLEGYLDVKFAADKTQELKLLVLLPFLIQFLMLVARNDFFDDWSWTPMLVCVFGCNIILSAIAWIILRRAATKLKEDALRALGKNLFQAGRAAKSKRQAGLLEIKQRIEAEARGAYARWFQDPAFMAMLVPTGLFGILSVLFRTLFVAS
jgi:hypothetical protein